MTMEKNTKKRTKLTFIGQEEEMNDHNSAAILEKKLPRGARYWTR